MPNYFIIYIKDCILSRRRIYYYDQEKRPVDCVLPLISGEEIAETFSCFSSILFHKKKKRFLAFIYFIMASRKIFFFPTTNRVV